METHNVEAKSAPECPYDPWETRSAGPVPDAPLAAIATDGGLDTLARHQVLLTGAVLGDIIRTTHACPTHLPAMLVLRPGGKYGAELVPAAGGTAGAVIVGAHHHCGDLLAGHDSLPR